MAPVATQIPATTSVAGKKKPVIEGELDFSSSVIAADVRENNYENYKYKDLVPQYPEINWDPLELVEVRKDRALLADPNNSYANLFRDATLVRHLNPKIGTEIYGVKLTELDDTQKNELALLLSNRIVVFFKDQEDFNLDKQLEFGRYFGPLHKHPSAGYPIINGKEYDEVVAIWSDTFRGKKSLNNGYPAWHSDATFEKQPPAYALLKIITNPSTGGDTLWTSGYALYDALSPGLKKYLEGLTAIHSDKLIYEGFTKAGKHVRRKVVYNEHPVIRTHPVTGYKSLFVNPNFTQSIVGIPKGESDAILKYLFTLISTFQEATVRYKWSTNDVAIWDNRPSLHAPTSDFDVELRHGVRVTPIGEAPYFDPNSKSQQADWDADLKKKQEAAAAAK
jgi:alpha-ketoglutarate-dependent taurine dioxygenase